MYIRPVHAELNIPALHQFIRENPLGLFTTSIAHPKNATIQTTHIPFVLDSPSDASDESNKGVLRAHIARANPQSKSIIDSLSQNGSESDLLEEEVLVLFNSPVHSYVTPKFYVETKPKDGKVVPTWDYAAVQVYGKSRIYYKNTPETSEFLQKQVEELSLQNEQQFIDKNKGTREGSKPWKVSDAPTKYVDLLKKAIIGIEIKIERIEGRFKLSQESNDGDWNGVVEGYRSLKTEEGEKMADLVEGRGTERTSKKGVCPIS
ncbi:uncharacterized protein I303_108704 [Kwoniella dejecticola CBS 10117]|uniref:Transcriptional regulator n=1 Tax=Kwoniella dejecticola CBS 10117 TaxID=1296121 RepID=A0A1A5ZWM9_9TREE|nr:transcriptional regulator [Kwoniella dejecticola CBS 10117]OBR82212.1 transcriptional regulator [Kwoniella dejecticola CBS 10117]